MGKEVEARILIRNCNLLKIPVLSIVYDMGIAFLGVGDARRRKATKGR